MNDLTSAPVPVTLEGGEVYLVSPLTLQDIATILKKAKQERLSMILGAIPQSLDSQSRQEMVQVALRDADSLDVQSPTIWTNVEILKLACWLALRKKHPALNFSQAEKILENEKEMLKILEVLNPQTLEEKVSEEDEKKTDSDLN